MLILSQLESDSSNFMEVKQPSSLPCASQRIYPTIVKLDELLSYTKRCPDVWSRHVSLKLKSDKDNSNYLVTKKVSVYMCACTLFVLLREFI